MRSCIHSTKRNTVRLASVAVTLMAGILSANGAQAQTGQVFTETNSPYGNSVVMFHRATNGMLTPIGTYFTGGMGTGSGLGNAGAVVLSPNHRCVYAVDAGSNDIAGFAIKYYGLQWVSNTPSGGTKPVSLTTCGNLVYVLNAGGTDNITGFTMNPDGTLTAIPNSTQTLSGTGTGAAEIKFTPDGRQLVVTEKGANKIDVFPVDGNGAAGPAVITNSIGMTPFGFDFDPAGHLIVSEAFGGAVGASALSSYFVSDFGSLPITESAPDGQAAACWVAVSKAGNYAWTTNTASANISAYYVGRFGRLSLFSGSGVAATLGNGAKPTDIAMDSSKKYLYVLESGPGVICSFWIGADGSLTSLGASGNLGPGMTGLAAF